MRVAQPVQTSGTLSKPATRLGVDPKFLTHVLTILSNLYSDVALAILREYATNAYDSHIAAGITRPIEVTLPTLYEPTLTVRDYGTGLTATEVVTIFGTYGASTKRERDDQVGAFGVGAKAAYAVGPSFSVTARKGGMECNALFAVDAEGHPTVVTTDPAPCDEPNGVTVRVSVDDVSQYENLAARFFATWPHGSVLVNGEPPVHVLDNMLQLGEVGWSGDWKSFAALEVGANRVIVLMGPVAYQVSPEIVAAVERQLASADGRGWCLQAGLVRLCLRMELGAVDLTPSREGLRDTERTRNALAAAILAADAEVEALYQDAQNAPDPFSAYQAWAALRKLTPRLTVTGPRPHAHPSWRGEPLATVDLSACPDLVYPATLSLLRTPEGKWRTTTVRYRTEKVDPGDGESLLVVTDVPPNKERYVQRALAGWVPSRYPGHAEHGEFRRVILSPVSAGQVGWVRFGNGRGAETVRFSDLQASVKAAAALQRTTTATATVKRTRGADAYEVLLPGNETPQQRTAAELATLNTPITSVPSICAAARRVAAQVPVVLLNRRRAQTLANAVPMTVPFREAEHLWALATLDTVTESERAAGFALDPSAWWAIQQLARLMGKVSDDLSDFTDPVLRRWLSIERDRAARVNDEAFADRLTLLQTAATQCASPEARWGSLRDTYPLLRPAHLSGLPAQAIADALAYVNSKRLDPTFQQEMLGAAVTAEQSTPKGN